MKMFVAGEWIDKAQRIEVLNPYDSSVVDTVPRTELDDVERALESAGRGALIMAELSGYERSKILRRAADLRKVLHRGSSRRHHQCGNLPGGYHRGTVPAVIKVLATCS